MNASRLSQASIIDGLRRKGFKATSQRIAICRFIVDNREHPTAETIYREVRKVHPTVSLATVYKTLRVLKKLGLVHELASATGQTTRFDSYVEPHLHLVCERCGEITDFEDRIARDIVARIGARARFTVVGQRFDVYGICQRCSRVKTGATRTESTGIAPLH